MFISFTHLAPLQLLVMKILSRLKSVSGFVFAKASAEGNQYWLPGKHTVRFEQGRGRKVEEDLLGSEGSRHSVCTL